MELNNDDKKRTLMRSLFCGEKDIRASPQQARQINEAKKSASIRTLFDTSAVILDNVEGGKEVKESVQVGETVMEPVKKTVKKAKHHVENRIIKHVTEKTKEAAKKTAKETGKQAVKTTVKETTKETAKTVAKTSAQVAAKVGTAASGSAGGPWGLLIGVAVGEVVGESIEKVNYRAGKRSRMIRYVADKGKQAEGGENNKGGKDNIFKLQFDYFKKYMWQVIRVNILKPLKYALLPIFLPVIILLLAALIYIQLLNASPLRYFLPATDYNSEEFYKQNDELIAAFENEYMSEAETYEDIDEIIITYDGESEMPAGFYLGATIVYSACEKEMKPSDEFKELFDEMYNYEIEIPENPSDDESEEARTLFIKITSKSVIEECEERGINEDMMQFVRELLTTLYHESEKEKENYEN